MSLVLRKNDEKWGKTAYETPTPAGPSTLFSAKDFATMRLSIAYLYATAAVALSGGPSPVSFGVGKSQIVLQPGVETLLLSHNVTAGGFATVNFFWITGDAVRMTP